MRHRWSLILAVAFLCLGAPAFAQDVCSVDIETATTRPDPPGTPTEVWVGVYVVDIHGIDDTDQEFLADLAFNLRWTDPRLADLANCRVGFLDIWNPGVRAINRREVETQDPELLVIGEGGVVTYNQRGYGSFSVPMDLRDFPMDSQTLPVRVIATNGPEEVAFRIDESMFGRQAELSLVGWDVGEMTYDTEPFFFEPQQRDLAAIRVILPASRQTGFYFWKLIVPLSIVVFMSWAVFWIDPAVAPARISLSATAVLTVFAYQFVLSNLLPRVSYLTRLDRYFVGAAVLVFLALVQSVTTVAIHRGGREELALKASRRARIIFPCLFVVMVLVAFWL